jgi:DNA-binding HxlR family transcriptional regulator
MTLRDHELGEKDTNVQEPTSAYHNPTEATLEQIGGKWKTAILCLLAERGALRNGEMMRLLAPITQKMLTEQLRELEKDQLITRTVFPEVPPKVIYELTDRGRSLRSVLDSLCEWGKRYANAIGHHE